MRLIRSSNGDYHTYPFCITTPGTTSFLDVAIATFVTCQWNYLVAKVDKYNCKLHWLFVSETCENRLWNYLVSVTRDLTRLSLTKKFVNQWSWFNSQIHGCKNVTISSQVSLTKFFIGCVSETGLDKREFHWQQKGQLDVWQVALTRGMVGDLY